MGNTTSSMWAIVPAILSVVVDAIVKLRPAKPKEIPPQLAPKMEDKEQLIRQAKHDLGMDVVNHINIAVVGNSGVGKSSLVNALMGLRNNQPGAAAVGVVETTMKMQKYPHPKNPNIMLWDIPGAGTLRMPASEYFDKNKLWGFDAVLIVSSDRFAQIDFQVFKKLREFDVPCVFVRTKADQSLVSLVENEMALDMQDAANLLQKQVRGDFENQMRLAGAPQTGLYLVCANAVRGIGKEHSAYVHYNMEEGIVDNSLKGVGMDENALLHFILYSLRPRLGV